MTTPIQTGRPVTNADRKYYEGKLYPFLAAKLPHHVDASGRLDVSSLAAAIGVTGQTLYSSMKVDRLSPRVAGLIVKESKGRLKVETVAPFMIEL